MAWPVADWLSFPAVILRPGHQLCRIHGREYDPEHYSNSGHQRFDPPRGRRRDYGVCYLAMEPIGAFLEVMSRYEDLDDPTIANYRLSEARLGRHLQLADLTDRSAGYYGVTAEHSAGNDYRISQQLSARLYDAHFEGIRYRIRHDPEMRLEAVALFRNARTDEPYHSPFRWQDPEEISEDLKRAARDYGIGVRRYQQPPSRRSTAWLRRILRR